MCRGKYVDVIINSLSHLTPLKEIKLMQQDKIKMERFKNKHTNKKYNFCCIVIEHEKKFFCTWFFSKFQKRVKYKKLM